MFISFTVFVVFLIRINYIHKCFLFSFLPLFCVVMLVHFSSFGCSFYTCLIFLYKVMLLRFSCFPINELPFLSFPFVCFHEIASSTLFFCLSLCSYRSFTPPVRVSDISGWKVLFLISMNWQFISFLVILSRELTFDKLTFTLFLFCPIVWINDHYFFRSVLMNRRSYISLSLFFFYIHFYFQLK